MEITEPVELIQNIGIRLVATTEDLDFSVGFGPNDYALTFFVTPKQGTEFTADKILKLPGGIDFQEFIPNELNTVFATCSLKQFDLVLTKSKSVSFINLAIGTKESAELTLIPDKIVLKDLLLEINIFDPLSHPLKMVSFRASCKFFPRIFQRPFYFLIEVDNIESKWKISTISGNYYGSVKLSDIINECTGNINTLPEELSNIYFSEFGVNIIKKDEGYSYTLYGQCETAISLFDTQLIASLSVIIDYAKTGYDISLKGFLLIGQQSFALDLELAKSQSTSPVSIILKADWKVIDQNYLPFEDIAKAFGFAEEEIPKIPQSLDPALKSATLTYDFSKKNLVIVLESENYGSAYFVAFKNLTDLPKSQFIFGLEVKGKSINLSNLPLIGKELSEKTSTVGVDNLQLLIASEQIKETTVQNINILISSSGKSSNVNLPNKDLDKGFNVSASLKFGESITPFSMPITEQSEPQTNVNALTTVQTSSPPPTTTNTQWFKLQKNFGPVHFEQVGVQYQDATLWFLLDASLSAGGLTLSLDGLACGSSLQKFKPEFKLAGIGIDYRGSGGLEIGGAFLKVPDKEEYLGEVIIKAATFSLIALGAYNVDPSSMFVYLALNTPLGGPAFFFVTGLAGGFGYNRDLIIPAIEQINTFPLIEAVMRDESSSADASDLGQSLERMKQYIPIAVGENWFAVGVRFSSFEMIDSFALLTVKFGTEVEIDVLGESTLTVPKIPVGGTPVPPIAKVQMVLKASFSAKTGILAVSSLLTSESYLFEQACHLTGGFAFYAWFAGEHAGDFVVTLGGYSRYFDKPDHYPSVPRLGISWQVTPELSIKGGMYFALTPSLVMAGGALEAVWQSGNLKAWFIADADFLIGWKPFHYQAQLRVTIGVSYQFCVFGISKCISVELGVDLSIKGPPFSGTATIHLYFISFTIAFGDRNVQPPPPLSWQEFEQSFLPSAKTEQPEATRSNANENTTTVINIQVADGLLKDLREETGHDVDYIINPHAFKLMSKTLIPANEAKFNENSHSGNWSNTPLCVKPMGEAGQNFQSCHSVKITYDEDKQLPDSFEIEAITASSPKAMWGNPNESQGELFKKTLIDNTFVGFTITPKPNQPDQLLPIAIASLQYSTESNPPKFNWSNPEIPKTDHFDQSTGIAQLQATINQQTINTKRANILQALSKQGLSINTNVNVSHLASSAQDVLLTPPILSLLGEEKR